MPAANDAASSHSRALSSGALVFVATTFGHAANFLFQMLMGRMLGQDQFGEFGVMNTMLSIFGLFTMPAMALQLSIARQTAIFDERGDADSIAAMLQRAARRLAFVSAAIVLAMLALSPWLKGYLKLDGYAPIWVTIGLGVVAVVSPLVNGALQGLKRFGWLSISGMLAPLIRIGVGVELVAIGWRASGALLGTFVGNVVLLGIASVVLAAYFRRRVAFRDMDTGVVYRYLGPTLVSLIAYAALVNIDLVVVKHYFSDEQAAQYSGATLFGRAIGWLMAPLCTVLFPHVWDETKSSANRALLLKFLLAAIALSVGGALVCTLGSGLLTTLLLGRTEETVAGLIRICVWAMLPIGVASLFLNFVMARGRYGFLAALVALVLLYLLAFAIWHDTFEHILMVVAGFGMAALVLFVVVAYRSPKTEA